MTGEWNSGVRVLIEKKNREYPSGKTWPQKAADYEKQP
jgi:hypothetical protein